MSNHLSSEELDFDWLTPYRAKRLKQPKQGRIYQVPRKKEAMKKARIILSRMRRESTTYSGLDQTRYIQHALRRICPFIFEELLLHCFEDMGFAVTRSSYTHDGGLDGIIWSDEGEKILLQAKRYWQNIEPDHVLDFIENVIDDSEAAQGLFVHTGTACDVSQQYMAPFSEHNIGFISDCSLKELVVQ